MVACLVVVSCRHELRHRPPDVGIVTYVFDGDTIAVELNGRVERVRLIGIDTPETVDPDTPPECGGTEATKFTESILPLGTEVRVVRDVEPRDGFNRLLAYIYLVADGRLVNAEIAEAGHATELFIEPNGALRAEVTAAIASAQSANVGIWGSCPTPGS